MFVILVRPAVRLSEELENLDEHIALGIGKETDMHIGIRFEIPVGQGRNRPVCGMPCLPYIPKRPSSGGEWWPRSRDIVRNS